ncbi:unnamed protein product [Gulo gulo]|uniref:Uncharacterized protein n=1 Tax=Gulo gulo TaxID=48420 RepID=A0A9X9Q1L1_GULGU|nr:unnamed protein product [Gulo gulo]
MAQQVSAITSGPSRCRRRTKISSDANWRIPKREQDGANHMTCHLRPSISTEMESG